MTDYLDGTTEANVIPTLVAAETLGALKSNMVLLGLVNRDYENEVAEMGDTVDVGIRGALTAQDKGEGSNVTIQAPTTTKATVSLNKHKEVTFGAEDVAIMFSRPDQIAGYAQDAAVAILEQVEADLAALYSGFSQTIDATGGLDEEDFRGARRLLNAAKVPLSNRFAVLHEDADYEMLSIERIVNRDYAESLGGALSNAYSGRAYGFDLFMDQNIAVATAVVKNLFGHRNAMTLATRPMRTTKLQTVSQVVMNEGGIGLRVTHWYNAQALAEQVTIDLLYGVAELRDNHMVVVSTTEI